MVEKLNYPCPCGGKLQWKKDKVIIEEVDCGILDVEYCPKCGEQYLPDESMEVVEEKLKQAGLWGVERRKISFWKSGNSVLFRLPTKLAKLLHLKPKGEGYVYPEGKNRLVIEF